MCCQFVKKALSPVSYNFKHRNDYTYGMEQVTVVRYSVANKRAGHLHIWRYELGTDKIYRYFYTDVLLVSVDIFSADNQGLG